MVAWATHCLRRLAVGQGAEQVLGAGDVFRARADEVVVHHQNPFLADRPGIRARHPRMGRCRYWAPLKVVTLQKLQFKGQPRVV